MSWDLAEDALATHRLTRLVLSDKITEPARDKIFEKFDPASSQLGYLLTCPWCASIWIGAGVAAFRTVAPSAWRPIALMLAASSVTGIIEERL